MARRLLRHPARHRGLPRTGRRVRRPGRRTAAETAVTAAGLHPAVEWTGYDVDQAPDRESVHVGIVDPARFHGSVVADHGGAVAGRSTTSAQAARPARPRGQRRLLRHLGCRRRPGHAVWARRLRGTLDSMSAGDRAALILGRRSRVDEPRPRAAPATAGPPSRSTASTGYRARPRLRPAGSVPDALPWQDFTCTSADDLVPVHARLRREPAHGRRRTGRTRPPRPRGRRGGGRRYGPGRRHGAPGHRYGRDVADRRTPSRDGG